MRQSSQGGWNSRWSFIAAATAATVGLGNLWKFSYLAGDNGGAVFVVVYIACVLLVGIPIMVAEVLLGSRGRTNPIAAMADVSIEANQSHLWQWVGWLGCVAGIIILSYYGVIAGWGLAYIEKLYSGDFLAVTAVASGTQFTQFLSEPADLVLWQSLYIVIIVLVVSLGVPMGVAMVSRLLLPLLLAALILLAIYSVRVGDINRTIEFLFTFDLNQLTGSTVLSALGHAFFTLSIGVGAIMAYGAYAPDKRSIMSMVSVVAVLDTIVALLAGIAIFPLVFALNVEPSMGPGLMFVALPYAFGNMVYGEYFGALFFIMVSFAAVGSGVALLEPWVAWLVERFRLWRPIAAALTGLLIWVLGLATVFSFNLLSDWRIAGLTLFSLLDLLSANILLPLSGFLIAVFVGWRLREEVLRDELYVEGRSLFLVWYRSLRYIAAPAVVVIFMFTLIQRFSS